MSWHSWLMDSTPEQRLAALRNESARHLAIIQGFMAIIRESLHDSNANDLPKEFEEWINKVISSADELKEIIEQLTDISPKD